MTYHITQLMDDARLRRGLLELNITVEDLTGEFSCLDFSQSLLKNHRAVFDRLSALGGEELLGRLLESGSPCMTDDPKSAKQGVRPIKGTEKYFLKTNAGGPTVLASILGAIAFWMKEQGRDPDEALLFHTEEEVCGEEGDEETGDILSYLADQFRAQNGLFSVLPPRPCSLIQKNGKYALFYEDDKSFLSVNFTDDEDKEISTTEFAQCRLMDEERPELGWQYALSDSKDAPWGWISACGNHYLAPEFKEFFPAEIRLDLNGDCRAEDVSRDCSICRWIDSSFNAFCAVGWSCTGYELYFLCPGEDSAPWRMECVNLGFSTGSKLLGLEISSLEIYEAGNNWLYSINDSLGRCVIDSNEYECKRENGILALTASNVFSSETYRWPAALSFSGVRTTLEKGRQYPEGVVSLASGDGVSVFALRRDGWWAVAKMDDWDDIWEGHSLKLLTPFAFTDVPKYIKEASNGLLETSAFVMVDRFGKKGVFDCEKGTYPVPCDYEEIEEVEEEFTGAFTVRRMGYEGRIDHNGKWVEHLHRKED